MFAPYSYSILCLDFLWVVSCIATRLYFRLGSQYLIESKNLMLEIFEKLLMFGIGGTVVTELDVQPFRIVAYDSSLI